ncbi:MAG: ScaI family restriction endonuclease [Blastocatellia bacterium]|nr:ScaI family restriction endonuclease [Blastocatellia bacterium]
MASPYEGLPIEKWGAKTKGLIRQHPLGLEVIEEAALASWDTLWSTKIGRGKTAIRLDRMNLPATITGYFFEKLFVRELQSRFPSEWRGAESKDEKDIVYIVPLNMEIYSNSKVKVNGDYRLPPVSPKRLLFMILLDLGFPVSNPDFRNQIINNPFNTKIERLSLIHVKLAYFLCVLIFTLKTSFNNSLIRVSKSFTSKDIITDFQLSNKKRFLSFSSFLDIMRV